MLNYGLTIFNVTFVYRNYKFLTKHQVTLKLGVYLITILLSNLRIEDYIPVKMRFRD